MNDELRKKLLVSKISVMVVELSSRVGRNDYETVDFTTLTIDELEHVRKDLHELLYAPPPRQ